MAELLRTGELESLSLAWENVHGYDSIPTIERVYPRTERGAYMCVWPGCRFARRDPVALWRHVHGGHGRDDLPPRWLASRRSRHGAGRMIVLVSLCSDGKGGGCGKPVTGPRVSAHGPLDYGAFIGGGEFDALLKQSGYRPNAVYGTGGTWGPPLLMHLECGRAAGLPVPEGL